MCTDCVSHTFIPADVEKHYFYLSIASYLLKRASNLIYHLQGALDASNGVILSRVGDVLCRGGRAAGNRGARSSSTSSNDDAKK